MSPSMRHKHTYITMAPSSIFAILATAAHVAATSYYVDCSQSAAGSGTLSSPWNSLSSVNSRTFAAGDVISLRTGTTCTGTLAPKGSGTAGNVITVTKYAPDSNTAKPIINGNGSGTAVNLTNVDYWTLFDFQVTNPATAEARRNGIVAMSSDGTTHRGITIDSVTVSKVAGQTNKATHAADFSLSSCIYVNTDGSAGSRWEDVLVQRNGLYDCGGGGLKVRTGNLGELGSNVHVTNNNVDSCGGDGILVAYTDSPLIDYNVAANLGKGAYPFTGGNFAGMWVLGDHNPVLSHNVVYGSVMSAIDSEAFDCDWGNTGTCTVEYNYSHDNAGGAFLNCDGCGTAPGGATQIVRYNIFQDDCRMYSNGDNVTLQFYQNVMYCPDKNFEIGVPKNTEFTNNIFVGNNNSTLPARDGIVWAWNVFQNVPMPSDNGIPGDPGFVNPGLGANTLDSVTGYKLKKTSPALSNGAVIANNGGLDYWGDAVSATAKPNRGAYQGPGL